MLQHRFSMTYPVFSIRTPGVRYKDMVRCGELRGTSHGVVFQSRGVGSKWRKKLPLNLYEILG